MVTLLAAALVFWALTKGLHFDESLALRSGWLGVARADATPLLWSPWTAWLGLLARTTDPAVTLYGARLVTLAALGGALALRVRGWSLASLALALVVAFCFDPVAAHLLEFRYDAALLALALVLEARLIDDERPLDLVFGVALGLLALHHVKGLALGCGYFGLACLARRPWRELVRALGGALAVVALWLALSEALALRAAVVGGYTTFARLGLDATHSAFAEGNRQGLVDALPLLGLAALGVTLALLRARRRSTTPHLTSAERAHSPSTVAGRWRGGSGWFVPRGGVLLFFLLALTHPHPFPYHFAPLLFLAALLGVELLELTPRAALLATVTLVVVAGATFVFASRGPGATFARTSRVPLSAAVTTTQLARAAAQPGDRALDPSGVLYFLPPCSREWYADVLFAPAIRRGAWMQSPLAPGCVWSLRTSRLDFVPAARLRELGPLQAHPGTGGLLSSVETPRHVPRGDLGERTDSNW